MTKQTPVACAAPALTDGKLAEYRTIIESLPQSPVRDAMQTCLNCVLAWWALPESTREPSEKWKLTASSSISVVPLEKEHVASLWDVTPWDYECDAMRDLVQTVQLAEHNRNSAKREAWNAAVTQLIISRHFPERAEFDALTQLRAKAEQLLTLVSSDERARLTVSFDKLTACCNAVHIALQTRSYDGLPYPMLESEAVRDAALHLVWHAMELTRDREPLTQDKLLPHVA